MARISSFEPVAEPNARVLILGSMPGKVSLAAGQYYAHPRNAFWVIMGELIGAYPRLPYQQRLRILRASGIALWDVLESCFRTGSLDSRIETGSASPNDFAAFFLQHQNIRRVFFNGAKAEQYFLRHALPALEPVQLTFQRLPSTSPANAGISYAQKLHAWQSILREA